MEITYVIEETFKKLLNSYNGKEKLIFPRKRDSTIRVSEQEARFCFASIIEEETDYRYSTETPTNKKYLRKKNDDQDSIETPTEDENSQNGTGGRSAQSDMSIWRNNDTKKLCNKLYNIEFKAHNARKESIDKDIEKLVKEGIEGIWFHVFRDADKATFPALAKKFEDSLIKYDKDRKKDIIFAICVLDQKIGICGKLLSGMKSRDEIVAFFEEAPSLMKADQENKTTHWKKYSF